MEITNGSWSPQRENKDADPHGSPIRSEPPFSHQWATYAMEARQQLSCCTEPILYFAAWTSLFFSLLKPCWEYSVMQSR